MEMTGVMKAMRMRQTTNQAYSGREMPSPLPFREGKKNQRPKTSTATVKRRTAAVKGCMNRRTIFRYM